MMLRILINESYPPSVRLPSVRSRIGERRLSRAPDEMLRKRYPERQATRTKPSRGD